MPAFVDCKTSLPMMTTKLPAQVIDMTGQKCGRLTVLNFAGTRNEKAYWLCLCDCGKQSEVLGKFLRNGTTKSCGCLSSDTTALRSLRHGHSQRGNRRPEYRCWKAVIQRCTNTNATYYENYGGRGIKVCEGFVNYETFFSTLGTKPTRKHEIDRVDNDLHYSCGSCAQCLREGWKMNLRWATRIQSSNNRRNNHFVEFQGIKLTLTQWAEKIGINANSIKNRLRRGWSVAKALTQPLNEAISRATTASGKHAAVVRRANAEKRKLQPA